MIDSKTKQLYLIDAYAMIFRGYYALIRNPRVTSTGIDTSAIFGFTNSLIELIKKEKPTHLAVVFDVGKSNVRTEDFADYKANRSETPEAIKVGVPYIQEILKAMHIPILGIEGYEADDVIGTIAKKAEKQNFEVFMVTPDKDFGQLVSDQIKIYKPASKNSGVEIIGKKEILEKYNIQDPLQIIDFLAMMGDAVDNIPGLDGVGEKTALKFLEQFGSIENLLNNTHTLKGKIKEKIEASRDKGLLSKKLATIICDAPIDFEEENYFVQTPDFQKIKEIFDQIEFKRLYDLLYKVFHPIDKPLSSLPEEKKEEKIPDLFSNLEENEENSNFSTKKNISNTQNILQYINQEKILFLLNQNLLKQNSVAFSFLYNQNETQIIGISFCYKNDLAYYVPLDKNNEKNIFIFKDFFENENITKIGHHLKSDYKILSDFGIELKGKNFDTMIAHYLLQPDSRHNIEFLSEIYLSYQPIPLENILGKKGKNQRSLESISIPELTEISAEKSLICYQLYQIFDEKLKNEQLDTLFHQIEMPLMQVLGEMEKIGVLVDTHWLKEESLELEKELKNLEKEIFIHAQEEFNLNSPKQLGEILFDKLNLDPKAKKTKTGQYSTSEEILQKLAPKHEIIPLILQYRTYQKLKSTYVDALPEEISDKDGRIHTHFSQTTAATGRLASQNPNLQNIPIRTERGQKIRGAFIAEKNHKIISADYSQIELRLIAEMSQEETLIQAFKNGEDIHASTASKLFNIPISEVSKTQRSQAKSVNFGIIYGQGAKALSEQTGLSLSQAKQLIDSYYQTYPNLKNFMNHQIQKAREEGFVQTILGRKRHLRDINSNNFVVKGHAERNAINAPIQGSAADIIKIAMINISNQIKKQNLKTKMLLQVHDELLFEVPENEIDTITPLIKNEMENALKTQVPLLVEIGIGDNWLEAH